MSLTSGVWDNLTDSVERQAKGINAKCDRHDFNVEECARNGATEIVIGMIVELESTLRVLKRRLVQTLPAEEQSKYPPII